MIVFSKTLGTCQLLAQECALGTGYTEVGRVSQETGK